MSSSSPPDEAVESLKDCNKLKDEDEAPMEDAAEAKREDGTSDEPKLSKSQLKKKRRWERKLEVKKRRKQQEKEIKRAKAKAEGRDLEQERLEQQKRQEDGAGRKKRQEKWEKEKVPLIQKSFQVVIDCSFEDQMTKKEVNSLSSQIRYCYSTNRNNPHPCMFTVTSLAGTTFANLQNVSGFEGWTTRAFASSDKPLDEVFQDRKKDIVYLTSDSDNEIDDLDDSKIYVIGGIVDRNRLTRAAIDRAEKLGLSTAKLPLEKHLQKMKTTKVLTCNHVFEILLKYRQHGKNWEKALLEVLPSRKEVAAASSSAAEKENGNGSAEKDDTAASKDDDKPEQEQSVDAKTS